MCVLGESFWGCSKCQLGMRPSIVRYTAHNYQGEEQYRDTLSSYVEERKILFDKKKKKKQFWFDKKKFDFL